MENYFNQPLSEEIFKQKYCLNGETSVEEVLRGIAEDISLAEESGELQAYWKEKFYQEMNNQKLFPAGRIMANARPDTKMRFYNNCYTIGIDDSIDDIYKALRDDAKISSTGGGVGMNVSKIRYKGCPVSKGGESSGVISFLKVFDQSAQVIHTGGQRRAAHIAILDITHPEVEDFITCKRGEENNTLTQFNISVGITDAFMEAVEADADWDLVFNGEVVKTVRAKYLFDLLTENSFMHNEPGVFNRDIVERYNNGYYAFTMDSVNPCLVGSTKVNTNYGIVNLKTLVEEFKAGKPYKVFAVDTEGALKLSPVTWADLTQVKAQTIEIEFTNGKVLKLTPDHKIFISATQTMTALEYLQLWEHLSKREKRRGEYPHPVILNRSMQNEHYVKVKASTQEEYTLEHHFIYGKSVPKDFDIHHKDENTLNNSEENLECISHSDHSKLSNIGHGDYKDGRKKKKLTLKHHGDKPNRSKITDIRWGKKEDVYDITVKHWHNFFAEGILVHNCGF